MLAVISQGALTPVGLTAAETCAAIRARVSAFKDSMFLLNTAEWEPIVAAIVPLRPRPREDRSFARLCAMAALALEECLSGVPFEPAETALLLGVREPHRRDSDVTPRAGSLIAEIERKLGVCFHPDSQLLPLGNAAAFAGLVEARRLLRSGRVRACIVGGVDSLLNPADLERLERAYRINREGEAQGLVPGEAAAFVAVTLADVGRSSARWFVQGVGLAQEGNSTAVISEGHPTGRGLEAAWKAALRDARAKESSIGLRVSDLNGERYGAMDALIAVTRFYRTQREGLPLWHPAECVGETGAAAAALGMIVGGAALVGRYAPDGMVICEASSESGLRGACLLRGADAVGRIAEARRIDRPSLPLVVSQHAEDASFLWLLRDTAARAPNYDLPELARLDDRIEAHLSGLRAAGAIGWREVEVALGLQGAGELFAAAVIACESDRPARLLVVVDAAKGDRALLRGAISGIAWSSEESVRRALELLLARAGTHDRYVALRAAAAHRIELPGAIEQCLSDVDPGTRAAALRAAGELGEVRFSGACAAGLRADDAQERFWAAAGGALLGDSTGVSELRAEAESDGARAGLATELAVRLVSHRETLEWHAALAQTPARLRAAVRTAGALGDPGLVPWLVDAMALDPVARLSGEAFCAITGAELERDRLLRPAAEVPQSPPSDEADGEPVRDPDEALGWPSRERVQEWWSANRRRFRVGVRHLAGVPASEESASAVLRTASQRLRAAAAIELKLRAPHLPLFETRAAGARQAALLGVRFR